MNEKRISEFLKTTPFVLIDIAQAVSDAKIYKMQVDQAVNLLKESEKILALQEPKEDSPIARLLESIREFLYS